MSKKNTTTKSSLTEQDITDSVTLFEVKHNVFISIKQLRKWLPTVELALWFAKVYEFDYRKVSHLLRELFPTELMRELMAGDHSIELQDYLVDTIPEDVLTEAKAQFVEKPQPDEVLPQLWEAAHIQIAKSIQEVANKVVNTISKLPSKQGSMLFQNLAKMNRLRPTIGQYQANIKHKPVPDNLVVLDVSGSMTQSTIKTIINDVVALSWQANAHLAIVSDDTFYWEPGSFNVNNVLAKAQYNGTHYETLLPLFNKDWGVVVSIADYDSSRSAQWTLATAKGHIGQVLDISLVGRPTFLSECLGQLADEVTPLLVSRNVISGSYY